MNRKATINEIYLMNYNWCIRSGIIGSLLLALLNIIGICACGWSDDTIGLFCIMIVALWFSSGIMSDIPIFMPEEIGTESIESPKAIDILAPVMSVAFAILSHVGIIRGWGAFSLVVFNCIIILSCYIAWKCRYTCTCSNEECYDGEI